MAEVLEYAARLSQVIGARPSGTEEEQQASFFIEETFQQAGLDTSIEEFNCNPNYQLPRVICCVAAIVLGVLTIFLQVLVVPVFIVTLALAALFVLDLLGMPPLNKTAKRGISQNVVAKYIPGEALAPDGDDFLLDGAADSSAVLSGLDNGPGRGRLGRGGRGSSRKRKIVLIARYDSGKVQAELKPSFLKVLDVLPWIEIGGFALILVALLVRMIADAQGPLLMVLNALIVIGAVAVFIPVVLYIMHQTASWSDGANNNASGTAVMLEVAQRIAKSAKGSNEPALPAANRVNDADDLVVMHGEDAIAESGMLPVGTDLIYDEAAADEVSETALEEQAAAAQALAREELGAEVAAMPAGTRRPAAASTAEDEARFVQAREAQPVSVRESEPEAAPAQMAAPVYSSPAAPASGGSSNVPDWFKKGIEAANANKEAQELDKNTPIQRSRYSDALDAAHENSAGSIEEFAAREAAESAAASDDGFTSPWSVAAASSPAAAARRTRNAAASPRASAAPAAAQGQSRPAPAAAVQAQAQPQPQAAQAALVPQSIDGQVTGEISLAAAAAIEEAQAHEAAQLAQSVEEVAEQAATADRTISFIPVAADIPAEISAAEVVESVDATQTDLLAKTPEEILAEATSATGMAGNPRAAAGASSRDSKRQKRTIALPSLTGAIEAVSAKRQAAPLADDAERDPGEERVVVTKRDQVSPGARAIKAIPTISEPEPVAFASSSFEPVSDDLIANMEQDDIVIEDVDDSDYETNTTPTGAIAGPGYVEMPKSRVSRLKGIFGRKKRVEEESETSFVEAVGLDEDFDARKVGADRGGWESFQNESADWDGQAASAEPEISAEPATSAGSRASRPSARSQSGRSQSGRAQGAARQSKSAGSAAGARTATAKAAAGSAKAVKPAAAAGTGTATTGSAAAKPAAAKPAASASATAKPARSSRSGRGAHSRSLDEMRAEEKPARSRREASDWDDWGDYDDWNGGGFSLSRIGDAVKGATRGRGDDEAAAADEGASSREGGSRRGRSSRASDGKQRRKNPGDLLASMAQDAADEVNASDSAYAVTSGRVGRDRSRRDALDGLDGETMMDERESIRSFRTGTAPLTSFEDVAAFAGTLSAASDDEAAIASEPQGDMHDLAQPQGFQTEVWFVALGAELADAAGVKAFLAEHAADLRGAVVIDIEALGAGTLSLIESEGALRRTKTSSRMKRYVTKAGSALGMRIGSEKMNWRESAAYYTARRGLQTIHVAGMQNGKPAYMGEADDRIDNIDEDKLLENAAFVLELLHNI